mmetsp:Transcript_39099/g.94585  ORF Transcript_39099/g.94585 Transcript_39099/m.94585 type:complete len:467 (-) Transcript_39099:76-1476(-)
MSTKPKTAYVPPHRRKRNDDGVATISSSSSSEPQTLTSKPSGSQAEESVTAKLRTSHEPYQRSVTTSSRRDHYGDSSSSRHQKDAIVDGDGHEIHSFEDDISLPQFTRICCINLREREDRWETFRKRMRSALRIHDDTNTTITTTRSWSGVGVGVGVGGHFNSHTKAARDFFQKVERFEAVNGSEVLTQLSKEGERSSYDNDGEDNELPRLEWDATQNSLYDRHVQPPYTKMMSPGEVGCAMSHIRLWKQIVAAVAVEPNNNNDDSDDKDFTMLILEDDATFYTKKISNRQNHHQRGWHGQENDRSHNQNQNGIDFIYALSAAWKVLPSDWDILYLGFSDRGERHYVDPVTTTVVDGEHKDYDHRHSDPSSRSARDQNNDTIHVTTYKPTYGFHTHAYVLKSRSASVLVSNLPVSGPLDVWLADNQWFGLNVYCAVVDGEGWKNTGANLISQRRHDTKSDIRQSGR